MNTELQVEENLLFEIQEAEKVGLKAEDGKTYSFTVDFGGYFSIICC